MEDEMWISLWCGADIGNIMTERNIMEGEERGWTMWEVRDY
jgi:hypothetical protein